MLSVRIIVIASAAIVGADGLAATGTGGIARKSLDQRLPAVAGSFVTAKPTAAVVPQHREEAPVRRICPERGWPYGAPRCIASQDRGPARIIALDAIRAAGETL